jgi:hypothetical protein
MEPAVQHRGRLWRWIATAVGLALLALLVHDLDPRRLAAALAGADWRWVVLAAALNLTVNLAARVARARSLLEPLRPRAAPTRRELCEVLLSSWAWSNLLPARAGDALRAAVLHRRHGYPLGALVAVQLFEKVVEAQSLGVFAIPLLAVATPPGAVAAPAWIFAAVAALGALAIVWGARRRRGPTPPPSAALSAARRFLWRLAEAWRLLHSPRPWSRALGWSCLSDLADAAMIGLCLAAVGVSLGPAAWLTVLLSVNLAIALPSTPAHLGVFEAAAVLALGAFAVPSDQALAFALLYHAAHVLPVTIVGLLVPPPRSARRAVSP